MDRSIYLDSLMRSIDLFEKAYAVQFKSLADFYGKVSKSAKPEVAFNYEGSPTPARGPLPKLEVMNLAPFMLGSALTVSAIKLYGALDHYMFKLTEANYDQPKLIDQTWWAPHMVEAVLGVNPASCTNWEEVAALREIWLHFFKHDEATDLPPTLNDQNIRADFQSVRVFAIDFEAACIIQNPNLRLK